MNRAAILTAALLLCGCSDSQRFSSAVEGLAVATPMARYDHPYHGPTVIHDVSLKEARRRCAGRDACNYVLEGKCHLIIPNQREAPVHDRAAYVRWERAGCNGHPDETISVRVKP